jgi:hypothetical protein
MDEAFTRKVNLVGAWFGVVYVVLLLVGWLGVGGFFPLHRPDATAAEIAAFFRTKQVSLKFGMVLVMWGAMAFLPFTATMADYIAKVEGRYGPLASITAMAGYANAMLTFYPPLMWISNTFRATERPDSMIYMLNDEAWIQFIGGLSLIMPMYVTAAVAAFADRSPNPIFPRWSGYVSIVSFILFLPDQALFFFKTGPFAWNGLFAFWIPLAVFCTWFLMIGYLIGRNILQTMKATSTAAPLEAVAMIKA